MIAICLIVWLIAPIPLTILYVLANQKKKRREELLQHLYLQGRISAEELLHAGVTLPQTWQNPMPASGQPVSVQQAPVFTAPPPAPADPEQTLAAAAERAARIAEAELSGVPLTEASAAVPEPIAVPVPAEDAAEEEVTPTAEISEEEPVPAPQPVPSPAPVQHPVPVQPMVPPRRPASFDVSAITVMLSVGVLLIITAGLIFVRSAWSTLSDPGRLATLAAGSVLFFGTSALARRIWKLNRTGMAFFTLGAAFLPISVWAAGYLELLGEGLSGPGNPWLLALSAASFTVIALIAVKIYQQLGWGIAVLCGLTVTYLNAAAGIVPAGDFGDACYLILIAVYALLFAFGSRILRQRQMLPLAIGRPLEPFALIITGLAFFVMFSALTVSDAAQLSSVAVFLTAFAFFAPAMTERFRGVTAAATSILAIIGFGQLMTPLYDTVFSYTVYEDYIRHLPAEYFALLCIIGALLWLILLLTNSLPEQVRKGYFYAAFVLTVLSVPVRLGDFVRQLILLPCAAILLLAVWIAAARKRSAAPVSWLIAVQSWVLARTAAAMTLEFAEITRAQQDLLCSGLFLLCFAVFALTKKHRTAVSDLLFTISAGVCAMLSFSHSNVPAAVQLLASLVLAALIVLYWYMALQHDTEKPVQFVYAVLTPAMLAVSAVSVAANILDWEPVIMLCLWSVLSIAIGMATYLTTKRRFHEVRRLLFGLTIVPPMVIALSIRMFTSGDWIAVQQLICAAAAVGLWFLYANRGFHKLESASFLSALLLTMSATAGVVQEHIYDGKRPFTVWMIAALWVIALSLLSIVISKRILLFVGNYAVPAVMQFAAPLTALWLSVMLLDMHILNWDSFYFVFTLGVCVLAWFVTKKTHILMPAVCGFSLIFTLEAMRRHCIWSSDGFIAVMLLCFAGLTLLFPYLGTVMREMEDRPRNQRRTWVLTGLGGVIPFWLIEATAYGTVEDYYTGAQTRWMMFFVPVLLAGYILHFAKLVKTPQHQKAILTIAAALGMIAFWMQPLFDVSATYFEGKLHILPMIAFGVVIRRLYGEKTGGGFLFGIGVYAMLRLVFGAIATELPSDLLTVLVTALVMFVASFYIKQKKWFLLGGISLILTAAYMHMKFTDGRQWWVYLLLAGLVLIVVAASNEMLKQRGDSLKSRAGRLWEDWTW